MVEVTDSFLEQNPDVYIPTRHTAAGDPDRLAFRLPLSRRSGSNGGLRLPARCAV